MRPDDAARQIAAYEDMMSLGKRSRDEATRLAQAIAEFAPHCTVRITPGVPLTADELLRRIDALEPPTWTKPRGDHATRVAASDGFHHALGLVRYIVRDMQAEVKDEK